MPRVRVGAVCQRSMDIGVSMSVPKRREPRRTRQKRPTSPLPEPVADEFSEAEYETNVAPDLIEEGRSPSRGNDAESECNLPARNGAGVPD